MSPLASMKWYRHKTQQLWSPFIDMKIKHVIRLLLLTCIVATCCLFWSFSHDPSNFARKYSFLRSITMDDDRWTKAAKSGNFRLFLEKLRSKWNEDQWKVYTMTSHAWHGYEWYGQSKDLLHTTNMTGMSIYKCDLSLTLVDSLDTLFLVGLYDELNEASKRLAELYETQYQQDCVVSVVEVTIRSLGGLLSAYYLTGHDHLYQAAQLVGEKVDQAFQCGRATACRLMNLETGESWMNPSLAEANSFQLEFASLSWLTSNDKYIIRAKEANEFMDDIVKVGHPSGLIPINLYWEIERDVPSEISFGAGGDNYYEYLLKQWLLFDKGDDKLKIRYETAIEHMTSQLIGQVPGTDAIYLGTIDINGEFISKMEQLSCFVPGMLALGVYHGMPDTHLKLATQLIETCVNMYFQMPSGLAPEVVHFGDVPAQDAARPSLDHTMFVFSQDDYYALRPETIESLFILYRVTKNESYRRYGQRIMTAIEHHCKVPDGGYHSVGNVTGSNPSRYGDVMESYFLAETLKYLFLLFTNQDDVFPLSSMVFNTKGHPLPTQAFVDIMRRKNLKGGNYTATNRVGLNPRKVVD